MKTNFKTHFVFMLALILAACGPQGTPTPALVIPSTPLSIVRLEDRLMASIDTNQHALATPNMFGNHPGEIAYANGFIWVHLTNGHVVQVDPATNSMVSAVKADTTTIPQDHYCEGIGTDGKDIWVCSAAGDEDHKTINVVRVDGSTHSIATTFEIGMIWGQTSLPFVQNQIWALTGDGSKLVGIDVSKNQANPAIDLGVRCLNMTALGDSLLATCPLSNLVVKIDPGKREVIARQTLQSPTFIAATQNGIWVSQTNSITRLDSGSLNPIISITGFSNESQMYATDAAVWVWIPTAILYKINPATNQVVEEIKPDKPIRTGGGVLATSDSIWIEAGGENLLLRLTLK